MGKIYCIMGKSATGKDTIYKRLLADEKLNLKKIVTYTTRPIRAGKKPGEEYFYIGEDDVKKLDEEGKIVELRAYNTVHGIWKYMTVADENIDLKNNDYLIIGTPESYKGCVKFFGPDVMVPILITVPDGERLQRALNREKKQQNPKYEEMCRRFLSDAADFSEEKLKEAGIEHSFQNDNLDECYKTILKEVF